MIVRGAERQLVVVDPQERQALVMSADGLGAGMGSLTNNALVKMTVRDPRFAFEDLGAGERVLGYATRRVRVRSGSTIEVRVLGRTQRVSDSSTTEYWIAQRPAGFDVAALSAWGRSFGRGLVRTNPELQAQMADYERRFGDGLALRTVGVSYQIDQNGRATVDTVRSEVTELARWRVDPSAFAMPAGYQVTDVTQAVAAAGAASAAADSGRRAGRDTGSLGGAMKKAADESVRGNATDAVKRGIGGLFRGKRP